MIKSKEGVTRWHIPMLPMRVSRANQAHQYGIQMPLSLSWLRSNKGIQQNLHLAVYVSLILKETFTAIPMSVPSLKPIAKTAKEAFLFHPLSKSHVHQTGACTCDCAR